MDEKVKELIKKAGGNVEQLEGIMAPCKNCKHEKNCYEWPCKHEPIERVPSL